MGAWLVCPAWSVDKNEMGKRKIWIVNAAEMSDMNHWAMGYNINSRKTECWIVSRQIKRIYCFKWQTYSTLCRLCGTAAQLVHLWRSIIIQNSHTYWIWMTFLAAAIPPPTEKNVMCSIHREMKNPAKNACVQCTRKRIQQLPRNEKKKKRKNSKRNKWIIQMCVRTKKQWHKCCLILSIHHYRQ